MSSIQDPNPMGGDGPNKVGIGRAEEDGSGEVMAEEDEDEASSVEAAGRD